MDEDWSVSPVTQRLRDKAWSQLGTSGSGNHFVEFGAFSMTNDSLGLPAGEYISLLTHSGSRGTGAQVCQHYSRIAMARHTELPKELKHLAWLSLDDEAGQEYWAAMNLMGHYAAANHALIHKYIACSLGAEVVVEIENHHNFAWKERHVIGGRRARSDCASQRGDAGWRRRCAWGYPGLDGFAWFRRSRQGSGRNRWRAASHGAGRVMSRTKALQSFTWSAVKKQLAERDVRPCSQRRARRSAGRLQRYRRRYGRADRPGRCARPFRSEVSEDVPERRARGGLGRDARCGVRLRSGFCFRTIESWQRIRTAQPCCPY